jgi:prepilin signal peptidase PulO-like enzyme (type II secretory pathway)
MDLNSYLMFWVCVFGLCLGSFYNVVILRSLSGESIVFPPSKCPKCGNKLKPWHNIPVLSYIFLRGKCHFCKEPISIQYPIIELLTMLLFGLSFWKFGLSYTTLFVIFWLSCLLIMTATDIKEKLVDCNIAIALALSGILYAGIANGMHGVLHSALGLIAGALIMELIARAGFVIAKTRAMGEADTYVAGALGAMFGIFSIVKVLLISLFASMIFIIPVFLYNKYKANDKGTLITAILFTLSLVTFYTMWQNYWTLGCIVLTGFALARFVLKGINKSENRNYLPYVPALAAAAMYYIFFVL